MIGSSHLLPFKGHTGRIGNAMPLNKELEEKVTDKGNNLSSGVPGSNPGCVPK